MGVSCGGGQGADASLTPELRALLEDAAVPKQVHDWKQALHALKAQGVELRGAVDDTMLLSYALNPTHATQALADVAARNGQAAPTTSGRGCVGGACDDAGAQGGGGEGGC